MEIGLHASLVRTRNKKLGHFLFFNWGSVDPDVRLNLAMSSKAPLNHYPDRPNAQKIDKLIESQTREMDAGKRLAMLKEIAGLSREYPSGISLFGLNMIYAMNKRIDYTWGAKQWVDLQFWRIKKAR